MSAAAPDPTPTSEPSPPARPLWEVIALFTQLGFTAFGGPAAHVAMFERECVERRGWLDRRRFLDMLAITNLLPGPNSTEMAIHLGYARAGWPGLIAAGVCFILPAALMCTALAVLYETYAVLPAVAGMFRGVQPVMWVVIADAVRRLGRDAVPDRLRAVIAVAAGAAGLAQVTEPAVLAAAGVVGWLVYAPRSSAPPAAMLAWVPAPILAAAPPAAAAMDRLLPMTLHFLKTGAILFGSGYLLINYLRSDLVIREGWLTERELLDGIAVGQFTPGPVLTAAAFLGYRLAGPAGAASATAAIFLPAFVAVAAIAGRFETLRSLGGLSAVLSGVNAAVTGLMAAVLVQLAPSLFAPGGRPDAYAIAAAVVGGIVLWRKINPTWLVPPAAAAGWWVYGG
jgi:chromate transporter